MRTIPFLVPLAATLAANGSTQLTYSVPNSWKWHLFHLWAISTGAFSIFQLQDNTGLSYANVTQAAPLLSTFLQSPANAFGAFYQLEVPADLDGGKIFQIGIIDTSNAQNLVQMLLSSTAEIP